MDRQIVLFESGQWQATEAAYTVLSAKGNLHKKICSFGGSEFSQFLNSHSSLDIYAIFVPAAMAADAGIIEMCNKHPLRNQVIFVEDGPQGTTQTFSPIHTFTRVRSKDLEDAYLLENLLTATATRRPPGFKAFLAKGSSIYAENVFKATGLGQKLDPCFQLAASHLGETRALHVWSILSLFVNHALTGLNQYLDDSSNKRVKVQLGADGDRVCLSVSYPVTEQTSKDLYFGLQELYTSFDENQWLAPWREAGYLEVSHYQVSQRGEVIAFFEKKPRASYLPFVVRSITTNEVESAEDAKAFQYKLFTAIKEAVEKGDTTIVAGATAAKPKMKLSERMSQITQKHGGNVTVIAGGKAPSAEEPIVIKGVTQNINNESVLVIKGGDSMPEGTATLKHVIASPGADAATAAGADSAESEDVEDDNDILAALAEVSAQIEADDEGEEAIPAEAAPGAGATDPLQLNSPQEQEKLKKLFSTDAIKKEKDPAKLMSILEERLKSAQEILNQRDTAMKKLYKQIDDLDPSRSGVLSGVVDTQKEGLKQNVTRLEAEIADATKREKELMTAVDKAVQAKDEAVKKLKVLEIKANGDQALAQKMQKLEKALEEEKRQKAELMKRMAGGKAA